ncbi:carbamoyl phosphate synthase II [Theileria orientalis]|uniref:Carbamoyl phosphate synthase II n=1 Tax=Theileria orientalis TaxID=68886 RepID=A0A976M687_THEOR|nr:carbamoyl phosphate synthase II [Theileria orientalis]
MDKGDLYGPPASLLLEDGRVFHGYSFGYDGGSSPNVDSSATTNPNGDLETSGEVVFSTCMLGYAESVTDANYAGQILVLTYPEIGNIGVPSNMLDEYGLLKFFESNHTYLRGLVVCNYSFKPSHWLAVETFSTFLKSKKVVAISCVDTRALTRHLTTYGTTLGKIILHKTPLYKRPNCVNPPSSPNLRVLDGLHGSAGSNSMGGLVNLGNMYKDLMLPGTFYDPSTKRLDELLPTLPTHYYSFFPHASTANTFSRVVVRYKFDLTELSKVVGDLKRVDFHKLYLNNVDFTNHTTALVGLSDSLNVLSESLTGLSESLDGLATKVEGLRLLVVVNFGLKNSILRSLLNNCPNNVRVLVVPYNCDFSVFDYDGLFLGNGPGNPNNYTEVVKVVRKALAKGKPIFGVCLGNLLLGLAGGYKCVKMHKGNYGANQPCIDLRTYKCYATSQSHRYMLVKDPSQGASRWCTLFENANDNSLEGLVNLDFPYFSVQFHPGSNPLHFRHPDGGEWKTYDLDTSFLYRDFFTCLMKRTLIPIHIRVMSSHIRCKRILLLSSGGLSIGQAGEFDYSGSQAIKALKESDAKIILVNPNIATVQTSKGMAHVTYFLPITFEYVKQIIEKEKPDGIMCAFGGQTGLNVGIELYEKKVLEDNNCEILGTSIKTIIDTEDRFLFNKKMTEIGERCAPSKECKSVEECVETAKKLGYPVLVRGNFELGGFGSGFADNETELLLIVNRMFGSNRGKTSTKDVCVHVDKSLKGWKEIEFEVLRDGNDNCVCAASMENFDPLGVHTGDSIVVAPAQTLSAGECSHLRQVAFNVVRHLDLVGECNIQFAVNPHKFEYFIVELNARLSRSSALASKATGYPLAYMAAKIALGYDLVQMRNSITLITTACFEPSLDYLVVKMPRWDLRKFENADNRIGSSMKSVGEVMAIGRTFEEVIQKSLRMVSESKLGFDSGSCSKLGLVEVKNLLENPTPERMHAIYRAFELGLTVEEVNTLTWIDNWFLHRLYNIYEWSNKLKARKLSDMTYDEMFHYKVLGFSDKQMAKFLAASPGASTGTASFEGANRAASGVKPDLTNATAASTRVDGAVDEEESCETEDNVRSHRLSLGVTAKVKIIDTLAAEYPVVTNYCYLTYNSVEHDILPLNYKLVSSPVSPGSNRTSVSTKFDDGTPHSKTPLSVKSSIVVLGCGAYRIGSSIEFDWSAVGCIKTLRKLGHSAIIVNCNPETVSTDFDVSDRLYFEELSVEMVYEIYRFESPNGIILSVGGQTANNLALKLDELRLNVLGTPVSSIDKCECRNKFSNICDLLGIDQPSWEEFTCVNAAKRFCEKVGFPVLARPSYVLSGASMKVILSHKELEMYLGTSAVVNRKHPVVISKFIQNAKEIEMDCVAKDGEIINYAISEHVENAGVHSGDATLILPAQNIFVDTHRRIKNITQKLAKHLKISGPFNVQFMCKKNKIKVIECNLRASRTFPFISSTFNVDFIELSTKVMVGVPVRRENIQLMDLDYVAVKMPLFSFDRLYPSDPLLGVEMKSTGEIAAFGDTKYEAFLKAMTACGMRIPEKGVLLSLGSRVNKFIFSRKIKGLLSLGLDVYATEGTYDYIKQMWESEHQFLVSNTNDEFYKGLQDANNTLGGLADGFVDDEFEFEVKRLGQFQKVHKPATPRPKSSDSSAENEEVFRLISEKKVDMFINVSDSVNSMYTTSGYVMRRAFVDSKLGLITSSKLAILLIDSLMYRRTRLDKGKEFISVKSHQDYLS